MGLQPPLNTLVFSVIGIEQKFAKEIYFYNKFFIQTFPRLPHLMSQIYVLLLYRQRHNFLL